MRPFPTGRISIKHSEVEYCNDMAGMGVLFDYIYIVRASPVSIHGGYLYFYTAIHEKLSVAVLQSNCRPFNIEYVSE
jgi:hypothetical protein